MGGSGKWIKSLINLGKSQPFDHVSSIFLLSLSFFTDFIMGLTVFLLFFLLIFYRIKEVVREGNGSCGGVHQVGSQ